MAKKEPTAKPVKADELSEDLRPAQQDEPREGTDPNRPISSSNPPPSKQPLREQHSPVTDGDDTMQKDEREVDEDLRESEQEVRRNTNSDSKKTKVTDK